MADLLTFQARDRITIRDAMLRTLRAGLLSRGVENANVTPGSDTYVEFEAVASQLAVTEANGIISADQVMPDTATGDALARICAIYGLAKQAAAGSVGPVIFVASATTTVATGDQLVDDAGLTYEVEVGGTYSDGSSIPIVAVSTGTTTNHAEGDVLRWVATPPFADEKVTVGPGGLVNGIDAEDDEVLRGRLYARLQNAPRSGNATQLAETSEEASPSVQKAFVYPAIRGGATYGVAVTAAPTATNKSRDLASTTLTGTVEPYIKAQYPEHADAVITTVTNVDADVAFGLVLPEAPTASPPGPGGGWKNGTPWPTPDGATTWRCTVTAVATTKVFTVDAQTLPTLNVSRIMWLSPTEWRLYEATVLTVTGSAGAYQISIDQPFVGIATGSYIFPACQNAQTYLDAVLAAFALMGPGEKTSNLSALVRGYRHPRPSNGWPSTLSGHLTRAITTAATEVESAQFLHRTDGTTTLTDSGGVVTPQVPAALTDAPKCFRPRHIGIYRVP